MISTLPWLAALSGAIAIASALGALPAAWLFASKPLTTLLIIAWAWPRGGDVPAQRRLVRLGLVLSLAGDVALLWPKQGFLPGLVSFLLAHLAYIGAFCVPARFASRRWPFAIYAVVASSILTLLWPGVPAGLRIPVLAYVLCLATMAAQTSVVWLQGRASADEPRLRRAAIGGALFAASDTLLATNRFASPLPFAALAILATYWSAQGLIAASLTARKR